MTSNWVLTRAQPDADADAALLRAAGMMAHAVPCIERIALPWPKWRTATARQVILVSSPFAAAQLALAWPTLSLPRPKVAAMAPITAAKLKEQGVSVDILAEGGVVALAGAIQKWSREHPGPLAVLYATSDAGFRQAEQDEAIALMRSFANVDRVAVYSTRAPPGLATALAALDPGLGYVFMSPSAVENAAPSLTRPSAVACIGQSTLRRAIELGVHPSPTPHSSFGAFVTALKEKTP